MQLGRGSLLSDVELHGRFAGLALFAVGRLLVERSEPDRYRPHAGPSDVVADPHQGIIDTARAGRNTQNGFRVGPGRELAAVLKPVRLDALMYLDYALHHENNHIA